MITKASSLRIAPWVALLAFGLVAWAALGFSVKSRESLTDQSALLEAIAQLKQQEATVIRELFYLDQQKKQNFADITAASKAHREAFEAVLSFADKNDDLTRREILAAYNAEAGFVEEYKSQWSISRNSQRSMLALSAPILAAAKDADDFEVYAALTQKRALVASGRIDELRSASDDLKRIDSFVNAHRDPELAIAWSVVQHHMDVYLSGIESGDVALQAYSTTPLASLIQQIRRDATASNRQLYQDEVARSNWAMGLCLVFLVLIAGLVARLSAALQRVSTENERLEEAVKARTHALEASMEEIQRLAEAKSSFLANMSHEIRTPMNGVMGMSELLAETELSEEQAGYVETIKGSADALLTIINDILDFSKAESGKLTLASEPFRLDELLETLTQLIAVTARSKNLEVILNYPPDAQAGFLGDDGRIRQVLLNIIGNAVKFTKQGFVGVDVECGVEGDMGAISIAVRDTGIGMPKDMLSKIFDSFIQVDGSSQREFEGTGLGLAISKRFVEAMGGDIDVDSEPGVGSTFTIRLRLPIANVDKRNTIRNVDIAALPKLKVLVVDDVELNRRILVQRYGYLGYEVVTASDGAEALRVLSREEHFDAPFDLAVLDYQMPHMDGIELTTLIRGAPRHENLPIIILSSVSGINQKPEIANMHRVVALEKPAATERLYATMFDVLDFDCAPASPRTATPSATLSALTELKSDGARVLLAEDTKTNQLLIKRIAEKSGFVLTIAENGQAAIEMFKSERPDVILMDWSMPVLSGLDATSAIRQIEEDEKLIRTPIIGLSANAMQEHKEQGLAAGMDAYLTKPIKKHDLLEALFRYCPPASAESKEAVS